jgi:hypothetical protein
MFLIAVVFSLVVSVQGASGKNDHLDKINGAITSVKCDRDILQRSIVAVLHALGDGMKTTPYVPGSIDDWVKFVPALTEFVKQATKNLNELDSAKLNLTTAELIVIAANATAFMRDFARQIEAVIDKLKTSLSTSELWVGSIVIRILPRSKFPEIKVMLKIFGQILKLTDATVDFVQAIHGRLGSTPPADLHDLPKALSKADRLLNGPWRVLIISVVVTMVIMLGVVFCCCCRRKPMYEL